MGQHRDLFLRHKHLTANPAGSALRPANGCTGGFDSGQTAYGMWQSRNHFTGFNLIAADSANYAVGSSFPETHGIYSMNRFGRMLQLGDDSLAEKNLAAHLASFTSSQPNRLTSGLRTGG